MFNRLFAKRDKGYTLIEILLALTIIGASMVLIFAILKPSLLNAGTKREQERLSSLAEGIVATYGRTQGDYAGLSLGSLQMNQVNGANIAGSGSSLSIQSQLGDPMEVRPATVRKANDGFDIVYKELNSKKCQRYIRAFQLPTFTVLVGADQTQVKQTTGANNGILASDEQILTACLAPEFKQNQGQIAFRFYEPLAAGTNTTGNGVAAVCGCTPQTQFRDTPCGPGQTGAFSEKRTSACDGGTPECPQPNWTAWQVTSNTCTGGPVALPLQSPPPQSPQSQCVPRNDVSVADCFDTAGNKTSGFVRLARPVTCASATGPEVPGAWATVASSCPSAQATVSCTPTSETRLKSDLSGNVLPNKGCPSGMNGYIEEARSSFCSSPYASPLWSTWTETANTCTTNANCHPTIERENRSCPAGYTGQEKWVRRQDCVNATDPRTDTGWVLEKDECVPVPNTTSNPNNTLCTSGYSYSFWGSAGSYVSENGWVGMPNNCFLQMGFPHYRIRFKNDMPEAYSDALLQGVETWTPFTAAELKAGQKGGCMISWWPEAVSNPACAPPPSPDVNNANNGMCYGGTSITSAFLHAFFLYDGTYSISAGVYSPNQWIVDSLNGVVAGGSWKDGTGIFNPSDYSVSFVGAQPQGDGTGGVNSVPTFYPNKGGTLDQTRELRWDDGTDPDALPVKGYFSIKKNGTEIKQIPVDVLLSAYVECP